MLAKYWKKICILILIIACVFNIMTKLIKASSLEKDLQKTVEINKKNNIEEKQKENK